VNNKQIFDAQKVLSKLQGTPVRLFNETGQAFWQVTYDDETYKLLLNVVSAVANTPIRSTYEVIEPQDYHREKI
jgi:hypothetical protein